MKLHLFACLFLGFSTFFTGCGKHGESVENVYATGPVTLDDFSEEFKTAGSSRDQKICRTADLVLGVESFDSTLLSLNLLLDSIGGYIARSSQNEAANGRGTSGVVDLRCPNNRFEEALVRIRMLGTVRFEKIESVDMSAEWQDDGARLRTQRQLEERLLQLLDTRTGKLEDILEVEEKLAEVRNTIEQIEGRRRHLEDQTTMATLSVKFEESGKTRDSDEPSVWEESFMAGIDGIVSLASWLLRWVVVLGPILLLLVPAVMLVRRKLKSRTVSVRDN